MFNERFTAIAAQLGDAQPAVRLAGAHAMAAWPMTGSRTSRPASTFPAPALRPGPESDQAAQAERTAYRANREVRHIIIRLTGAHLRPGAAVSRQGLNLDFTGVVFDGGDFSGAAISGGTVDFSGAARWAHPPMFSWDGEPPPGVVLPVQPP